MQAKGTSVPRVNFKVTATDDIGVVEDACEVEAERKLFEAAIVTKYFDVYKGCYSCKGKVTSTSNLLGVCFRSSTS